MQLHNRYLITESDEGVVVIDQHALHERILYEQLREQVLAGALESQALLVPEPVDLTPAEAAAALGSRDVLAQLGLTIEPFGGDTVLLSSYPAMLANFRPAEVLRRAGRRVVGFRQAAGAARRARLAIAHDLVQGGDQGGRPLDAARRLPRWWSSVIWPRTPIIVHTAGRRPWSFSREELDQQFKRT